jgi:hypothetical protein
MLEFRLVATTCLGARQARQADTPLIGGFHARPSAVAACGRASNSPRGRADPATVSRSAIPRPSVRPSKVVVAGKDEPGRRLIVTGRVSDGTTPVTGVSVYVFNTDADGFYAKGMKNLEGELNPRLHGVLRTDKDGQFQYETIRPGRYGKNGASHVHHVLRAPGYKPRLMDLWFDDDLIVIERRKAGQPEVPDSIRNSSVCRSAPDCVAVRPVTRDGNGIWHATRDFELIRE